MAQGVTSARHARRRLRLVRTLAVTATAAVISLTLVEVTGHPSHRAPPPARATARHGAAHTDAFSPSSWVASLEKKSANAPGYLQPGSDPSVLPGPILITDRNNNRLLLISPKGQILWQFPADGQLQPGQTFVSPDDAFFGPHGRHIVVTQEDDFVISVISLPSGRITWRYGHPGIPGATPGYVDTPTTPCCCPTVTC